MPQVPRREIKARAARLRMKGDEALKRHLDRSVGTCMVALVEDGLRARAPDYAEIRLQREVAGDFAGVRIVGHDGRRLEAAVLDAVA
jgi:threonylcarbamoyladenosine tRNA methylthiotransferase MtaB